MIYGLALVLIAAIGANSVRAQNLSTLCTDKATFKEFVDCSRIEAPEYKIALYSKNSALLQNKSSRRWLNPELDVQSLFGKALGNEQYQFQFSLMQTIAFGGRSARIYEAESIQESAEANLQNVDAEVRSKIYSKLLRLGQIEKEKSALDEAILTFKKLVAQFSSRPRLSPEQEVSNAVFKIAQGDFLIRKVQLMNDEREVVNELKIHLRTHDDSFKKWIKEPVVQLVEYKEDNFDLEQTPEYRLRHSEYLSAKASKSSENADAFSDIKIGPVVQLQYDGPQRLQLYGAQLTIPFPVWNQNGYGRESADYKIQAAEVGLDLEKRKVTLDRERLKNTYADYLSYLKQVPTQKDLESKHAKVEAQYMRGLVNSALIVEAHRSLIDFQKLRHSAEIQALEILWDLYRLDGRVEEIKL